MDSLPAVPLPIEATEKKNAAEIFYTNPMIAALLNAQPNPSAILTQEMLVVMLNEKFMRMFGINETQAIRGRKIGEVMGCIHTKNYKNECGRLESCAMCGFCGSGSDPAAREKTKETQFSVNGTCRNGKSTELAVRATLYSIKFDQENFLYLTIQNMAYHQALAKLEREFFHDANNFLSGILGASQLLGFEQDKNTQKMIGILQTNIQKLTAMMKTQRGLLLTELSAYQPELRDISVTEILKKMQRVYADRPLSKNKLLRLVVKSRDIALYNDFKLLMRVLDNMLANAFEATIPGGEVKLSVEERPGALTFSVWNRKAIPEDQVPNIFRRGFTTKMETGRGMGTFLIKFFGENVLGGQVCFTTSKTEGTLFSLTLPI